MSTPTVPLLEDDTVAFGDDLDSSNNNYGLKHPYVTFFHLAFRVLAVIAYMLCGWFSNSFITSFVAIVSLLSMDFWTVKNITGRLMVGLRWWNYVDEDGKSHWVYEARKGNQQNRINDKEANIFWTALVLTPLLWSVFFMIALFGFKLKWLLLVVIALMLNCANLFGYIKCKVGSSESLTTVTSNFLRKQVLQNAVTVMMGQTSSASQSNTQNRPVNVV